jgi:hypothetical protein
MMTVKDQVMLTVEDCNDLHVDKFVNRQNQYFILAIYYSFKTIVY